MKIKHLNWLKVLFYGNYLALKKIENFYSLPRSNGGNGGKKN